MFSDPRTPNSIAFPLAYQNYKKVAAIMRSHSVAPQNSHFLDKNNALRHTTSAKLNNHVSGAQQERGRRIRVSKDLARTKSKISQNQIKLMLLSSQGDIRDSADEIFNNAQHQNIEKMDFCACYFIRKMN